MANRYWVGGTGSWTASSTTVWSTTSGGAGGASVPGTGDNAIFDQNGPYTVTLNGSLLCNDLSVTGTSVTFNGSTGNLTIAGSMTLDASTGWSATNAITFASTVTGKLVNTNNVNIYAAVTFDGVGGGWNFFSAFKSSSITLNNGALNCAGSTITCANMVIAGSGTKSFTFNGSTVSLTGSGTPFNYSGSNCTFSAGSSNGLFTLNSSVTKTFSGNGVSYPATIDQAGSGALYITGSNTFVNVTNSYASTGATSIVFPSGITNVANWTACGSSGKVLQLTGGTVNYTGSGTIGGLNNLQIGIKVTPSPAANGSTPYVWYGDTTCTPLSSANYTTGFVATSSGYGTVYRITSTGSGTWTFPSDFNTANNNIYLFGGGGGGGGGYRDATGIVTVGGGGGGGGYRLIVNYNGSSPVSYSVGTGGAGGNGSAGGTGNSTTFGSYTATGGGGGGYATTNTTPSGGAGGTGTATGGAGGTGYGLQYGSLNSSWFATSSAGGGAGGPNGTGGAGGAAGIFSSSNTYNAAAGGGANGGGSNGKSYYWSQNGPPASPAGGNPVSAYGSGGAYVGYSTGGAGYGGGGGGSAYAYPASNITGGSGGDGFDVLGFLGGGGGGGGSLGLATSNSNGATGGLFGGGGAGGSWTFYGGVSTAGPGGNGAQGGIIIYYSPRSSSASSGAGLLMFF